MPSMLHVASVRPRPRTRLSGHGGHGDGLRLHSGLLGGRLRDGGVGGAGGADAAGAALQQLLHVVQLRPCESTAAVGCAIRMTFNWSFPKKSRKSLVISQWRTTVGWDRDPQAFSSDTLSFFTLLHDMHCRAHVLQSYQMAFISFKCKDPAIESKSGNKWENTGRLTLPASCFNRTILPSALQKVIKFRLAAGWNRV